MGKESDPAPLSQAALARLTARTLEAALSIAGTDRGNVQLVDAKTGVLTVVSQVGFDSEFLEYFAAVDDDNAACGRAARAHTQVVIPDVNRDPGFARHCAVRPRSCSEPWPVAS
jgi:GAF domain-containing protein